MVGWVNNQLTIAVTGMLGDVRQRLLGAMQQQQQQQLANQSTNNW